MAFRIELEDKQRESFEEYRYRIWRDGQLVAHYWHDYRGDDHGIRFLDGTSASWPVGNLLDFIQGGGSQPVALTPGAIAYLEQHAGASTSASAATMPPPMPAVVVDSAAAGSGSRTRRLLVVGALACWLACLFLPPLLIENRDSSGLGIAYLLTGWMGPLAMHFEWFANPMMLVAAIALWRGHPKTAFVAALLACFLIALLPMRGTIYADEGGREASILAFRLGYWLWFAAPAILAAGAMVNLRPASPRR